MGTNCALLVADLFLFCYERYFMLSPSDNSQTDIIEAFNSTSRYLDDLLHVNFPFLGGDVPRSPSYGLFFFSLLVLLECALMLMTSITETYF